MLPREPSNEPSATRGSVALRVAIAAVLAVLGVIVVIVLSKSAADTRAPLDPHSHDPAVSPPNGSASGTRTTDPGPTSSPVEHTPAPTTSASDTWRVIGRVHARGGASVPDATVRAEMMLAGETRALGSTHTAADGTYSIDAPMLATLDALSASLCSISIAVEAPHHAPTRAQSAFDPAAPDHAMHLDARVEEGERLTGRIVDTQKKPVAEATVRLSVASTKGGVAGFALVQEVATGSDGRFDLGFSSTAHYHLAARADGVGTAFVETLDLEAGAGRDLLDVALVGGPPIAGTVVHAGTTDPAAFFEVWAFDADFAGQSDAFALVVRRAVDVERGDGLTYTRAWTDAAGRFELRGLRPGQYVLRTPDPRAVLEPHQARFEPGIAGLDVQLFSSCIVVHVRDEDGRPVIGANVRLTELSTRADGSYEPAGTHLTTSRGTDGTAVFCFDPEAPCAVDAFTQTRRSAEQLVILAQNELVHAVDLVLPRRAATGRIQLDVQGEDGRPLEELQVELLSNVTRARREDVGMIESDAHGLLPPVPCGTYDLFVGYAPGKDRDHFPVRTQQPITVTPGDPVRVSLHPHRGARVQVSLMIDGSPPAGLASDPTGKTHVLSDDERRTRFGVAIVLARSDGTSRNLQFQIGGRMESHLLPGENATSFELVEPGTGTLTLSSSTAWTSTPVPVALVAGETAAASITIHAR